MGMTNEEAVVILKNAIKKPNTEDGYLGQALTMAIKALEKDIEKEPVQTHTRYGMGNEYHDYYCPSCDALLAPEPIGLRWKQEGGWSRCKNCFQKIKWEVDDD